jgi:hypothetical protein
MMTCSGGNLTAGLLAIRAGSAQYRARELNLLMGLAMPKRYLPAALLCAALLTSGITQPASSAPAKDGYPNTLMGRCMKEVGAYYDRTHNRYRLSASGSGSAQEQRYYDCLSRRNTQAVTRRKTTR